MGYDKIKGCKVRLRNAVYTLEKYEAEPSFFSADVIARQKERVADLGKELAMLKRIEERSGDLMNELKASEIF